MLESKEPVAKRRRGVVNSSKYLRNQVKYGRTHGKQYLNYKGNSVSAKTIGKPCSCPMKWFIKVDEDNRKCVFTKFYEMSSKNEQDTYIQGRIEICGVKRRRKITQPGIQTNRSYNHFIKANAINIKICQSAFLTIHGISKERMKWIKKLSCNNQTSQDQRGKNINVNVVSDRHRDEIKKHISSFSVKMNHYSNKEYQYLNAKLNLKIMYNLFREKYPNYPIKYSYYIKFFKENFQLHFGRPQVDVCNTCEDLDLKIKNPLLNVDAKRVAIAEKMVHQRRAKKFYSTLKTATEECQQRDDLVAISFDFMQNLQLRGFPTQDKFYLSQLTIGLFCITNLKSQKSFFYIYHEGIAFKGPNELCSFILDYIHKEINENVTELHLFCDNCPGQNKNLCMVKMCMALKSTGRFDKISQYFPIRGHSFLPCDRAFGTIKRKRQELFDCQGSCHRRDVKF
ncbi:uncharacterized protein LOC126749795 isoform X1 [Anthonomus grandis grandis]|uniref:uncharacterized protein LOC126749795 isoform X1 n=1 Tax=Anthonomus grandis grandis TaxID=2921223 RepID=UPI00216508F9|nr:uncharacterized protein LOC126749795 isoform X1 [Anthonomus grandis grandis]